MDKSSERLVLGAVGDIDLSGPTAQIMQIKGMLWPFERVHACLNEADLLFGNFESVILPPDYPDHEIHPDRMVSKFDASPALRTAGFDFLSLANNHRLDGGILGMFHTQEAIHRQGITTGGIGPTQPDARRLKCVTRNGFTLGFLCYSKDSKYVLSTKGPCYAFYDEATVIEDLRANRNQVDFLVLSIHADLEFSPTPSVPRRDAFRRFAREGADLILGHHPHVPQGIEIIDRCLIAYSLGNFVFPAHSCSYMKSHGPETSYTYLLLVELTQDGVKSFRRIPFVIDSFPDERPGVPEGRRYQELEDYLLNLDHMLTDDAIVAANWQSRALQQFQIVLAEAQKMTHKELLEYELGLLLFAGANRDWTREVLKIIQTNWDSHQSRVNQFHRPLDSVLQSLPMSADPPWISKLFRSTFERMPSSAKWRFRQLLSHMLE